MGGRKQTSEASRDPWGPTQAPLRAGISDLTDLYESGGLQINPYDGDLVADAPQAVTDARNGILGLVPGTQEAIAGAQDVFSNIASSDGYDAQRQRVIDAIMPALNATFAGSGMTGSSLHQQNLASGLASGLADAEMGFTDQRMRAASAIPGLAMEQFAPLNQALQVGTDMQRQEQAEIDALVQQDLMAQGAEANALQDYLSILSGVGGQFGTSTNVQRTRPGLLDYVSAGSQIGGLF